MLKTHNINETHARRDISLAAGLAAACLLLAATVCVAAPIDVPRMERAVQLRVATGQFTGTVLVAQDGKIVLNKAYGLADIAGKIPNTADTKFRIGSITKQFTAASLLLLQERGKLQVQDPLKKYLPDAPAAWDGITIYHVLTHTSGIPDIIDLPEYSSTESLSRPATPEQLVARFRDKPLDFAPGSSWHYSNAGYLLLGYLIEKISGVPYARFVHDNIFAPLGMDNSGYDWSRDKIPGHATGYILGPPGSKAPAVARYIDASIPFAAGALYSTTGDLLKWQRALYGGKLLKPESLKQMTTPFKENYGFALMIQPGAHRGQLIRHNGEIEGFNCYLSHETADNLDVIVLANLDDRAPELIGADLEKVAEGEPGPLMTGRVPKPVPVEALQRLSGHYATTDGTIYTVSRQGDHLLLQGRQLVELYPQSEAEFFAGTMDVQFLFESGADGQVADMVIQYPDHKATAARITDAEARQRAGASGQKPGEH